MAAHSYTLTISLLLMLLFSTLSSASDMSILTYDENHIHHRTDDEVAALYESWLIKHGKSYNALDEKEKRFQIFKDNLKYIDEQNSVPNKSYKLGLTEFADLTNEEYRSIYLGTKLSGDLGNVSDRYLPKSGDILPESVDWREKGVIVGVKNQGSCGGCWAFSAVASIESINAIVTGDLISLSEQQLIDCDRSSINNGCSGGLMSYAFEYVINNGGITSQQIYPYTARDGVCNQNAEGAKVVSIDGYENVPRYNEKALQKAVAGQPVSIVIEAGGRDFQHYTGGIFTGKCGTAYDHGVVAVGYGTQNGMDYWIIRNSWGPNWGEKGYMRIQRNVASSSGMCGLAILPSYAVKKAKPSSVCDDGYHQCPAGNTCCCVLEFQNSCLSYGCCPLEGATCCEDRTCCPRHAPVCNIREGICSVSKGNPLGVKAMKHILAEPIQAFGNGGKKSSF